VVDTAVKGQYMQLLNANSYEKGGWVLHMLRRKLGDELFWKGVRNYYAKYRGSNANTDDLRQIMEQTSGQDLKQFFNQWLRTAGHPDLNVAWHYDADKGAVNISIEQKQDNVYVFPLEISMAGQLHTITVNGKTATAQIAVKAKPETIVADPNVNLLATFNVIAN
jgi:aminopeptidase N